MRRKTSDAPARETAAGRAALETIGAPGARDSPAALTPPGQLAEYVGFQPTPYQQRLKARFWVTVRDNPMIDPDHATPDQVSRLVGDSAVVAWLRDPLCRSWFLGQDTWRADAEWNFQLWLEQINSAIISPHTATKDLIALGNLLIKLTGRDAKPADEEGPQMTPEQARAALVKGATSIGMKFPEPPVPAPVLDAPTKEETK